MKMKLIYEILQKEVAILSSGAILMYSNFQQEESRIDFV